MGNYLARGRNERSDVSASLPSKNQMSSCPARPNSVTE